jgi:hypothetical protein
MKIKNTFSTGKMNKDVDERLIQNGEFIDANNIRVLNTAGSDAGAIENEKGNVKLTNLAISNNPECIGSVADEAEEKIYWFIVNDDGFSYIYEYDRTNEITSQVLADERVGDQQVLGFSKDYKITGVNVVYNTSKKSKLLLFTDGLNQPRMIDIKRSKSYGLNNFYEDDISLYKKPPYQAPVVRPFNSLDSTENAVKEQFFSFGYRYRYLDGGYSAPSSFSYFQFTPKSFAVDFTAMENMGMENIFNGYNIKYNSGDHRVTDIQLLFKYPTEPTIYIVDSINKKDSSILDNTTQTYEFTNKKIFKTLPQDEVFRTFDDVPLTAKAQDFINDRLVFGNTTSQYDLVEEEGSDDKIRVVYEASLVSESQEGDRIDATLSVNDTKVTFDLTDFDLKKDFTITIVLLLNSDEQGTPPDEYFSGDANVQSAFVLLQDYADVSDLVESQEFLDCIASLSSSFSSVVTTTTPPDALDLVYGDVTLDSSTSTSFTLLAPTNVHTVDDTPADATDNDDPNFTTDIDEPYKFDAGSNLKIRENLSNISLKSNRSFEVGLCYLDSYGRYSSILLPKESIGESVSEVFVPIKHSVDLNKLKLKIFNKPPYWADRYKWFVKVNKGPHYNIYGTIFYEDGVYRWILLQGANLGKLEEGKNLIVKADDNGPLTQEVKCKILEISTKNAQDEEQAGEGWISGNKDSGGEKLIEKAGTYVKIRPNGFQMDFNPNNYINYHRSKKAGGGFLNTWAGTNEITLPAGGGSALMNLLLGLQGGLNEGILQVKNEAVNPPEWIDQAITAGTQITLNLVYSESDGSPNFSYFKQWTSNNEYETTATRNAFALFLDNETNFPKDTNYTLGGSQPGTVTRFTVDSQNNENERFYLTIYKSSRSYDLDRWVMLVSPSEGTATTENSRITVDLDFILITTLGIFETEPEDIDDDIYYETEETFLIENGLHKGNEQDQTATEPAISQLGFGNCFSFGNGVESIRIKDDRFKPHLDIKSRPNIAIVEGYERKEDSNKLIYSGAFNENTGYNTLNEFNSSRGITKYMDMKYGSVQKLFARESDLIVFQEDRVSKVLYGKNILNSPDGSGSISQIERVLGQDVPFSGEYGISTDPESFAFYEGRLYFADANRGAVLRLGGDGITPISYAGMKAFFKRELYNNKGNWNIGGFDPKFHQYVLTMGSEQKPADPLELDCASTFVRTITSAFNYDLNLGSFPGTATIAYTTSSSIDIVIVYNGNTYTNNGLTGTGNVTFPVTSTDLETTNIADVTITPASSAQVTITHTCPQPETLEIILVVVNDEGEATETIINRYKHDGANGNIYNSDLDVFEADELTRYEVISGFMGSDVIPDNGDTVILSSLKQAGVHTGDFNDCNSLGYLVSAAGSLTVQNIIDQATYPSVTGQTLSNGDEENTVSFTFNRNNTSEKLYLIWNYIDQLPVLVDDSITGITNGGSTIINVVANDTIPSPYTITIGTQPTNGTAVVNADNTITYTHTAEAGLDDSFTYIVDRGGTCTAEATVTTQALAISVDTYIYIYFDDSGSMATTETELNTLRTGALKSTLQDLYATAGTESSGNTDSATNGSDEYDNKVTIVYGGQATGTWQNERTLAALSDNDVNDFLATSTHNDFPTDASNVIVMVFQDESSPYNAEGSGTTAPTPTANYNTDIADLRSRVSSLNSTNSGFYRGVVFNVTGYAQFGAFLQAVENGTGSYSGTSGLSDLMGGSTPTFSFAYNVQESDNNDANAPFKPGSTTDRFDQWQYYYLWHITNELNALGFTPDGATWPVIIDD